MMAREAANLFYNKQPMKFATYSPPRHLARLHCITLSKPAKPLNVEEAKESFCYIKEIGVCMRVSKKLERGAERERERDGYKG